MTGIDVLVALAVLAGLLAIGLKAARPSGSTGEFFLAGREIPAWAAAVSFLATETSALTLLALPAASYRENWNYLQFFVGAALARIVVAYLFVPAFYRGDCTTVYEFLGQRFGPAPQRVGSGLFVVTRMLGSAVRLAAAGAAISAFLGWPASGTTLFLAAAAASYLSVGGLRSGIWAGVFQAAVIVAAGTAAAGYLFLHIEGGLPEALRLAGAAGRLEWAKWAVGPDSFWTVSATGFFGSLAAFGTDQEFMQRILAARTRTRSQNAVLMTIPAGLAFAALFLLTGTGLFAFYDQHPELALPDSPDRIFSHFALQILPGGLRGLFLAALVMASIDSPLTSLSSALVMDFYRPLRGKRAGEASCVRLGRRLIWVLALCLGLTAWLFGFWGKLSWVAFKIGAVAYGPLLGIFIYGLLWDTGEKEPGPGWAAAAAMIVVSAFSLLLLSASQQGRLPFSWNWLIPLGAAGTALLSWLWGPGPGVSGGPLGPRRGPN